MHKEKYTNIYFEKISNTYYIEHVMFSLYNNNTIKEKDVENTKTTEKYNRLQFQDYIH